MRHELQVYYLIPRRGGPITFKVDVYVKGVCVPICVPIMGALLCRFLGASGLAEAQHERLQNMIPIKQARRYGVVMITCSND